MLPAGPGSGVPYEQCNEEKNGKKKCMVNNVAARNQSRHKVLFLSVYVHIHIVL